MSTETGALDNGIAVLVKKLKGQRAWAIIPVLMFIFSPAVPPMVCETVFFYACLLKPP